MISTEYGEEDHSDRIKNLKEIKKRMEVIETVIKPGTSIEDILVLMPDWFDHVTEANEVVCEAETAVAKQFPTMDRINAILKKLETKEASNKFGL